MRQDRGMTRVGFVGVGRMGLPMCANLVRRGHRVLVADARGEAREQAALVGAGWRASAADIGRGADVVITMLPGAEQSIDVARRAMPGMRRGATWIDMGSNPPSTAAVLGSLAGSRLRVLDAPAGGGPDAAARARLQLFVGGERDVLAQHLDLLVCMADPARIHHLGVHGCGYTAKLLVNLLWFGQTIATTEALMLATHAGIEVGTMHDALDHSAVAGGFIGRDLAALLRGDYRTSFGLQGCYEELVAITDVARAAGTPFALSAVVTDLYRQALEHFGPVDGELMAAALLEHRAGRVLRG